MRRKKRAWTIHDLLNTPVKTFPFEERWYELFGQPERCGVWFIWGGSGNGKTSFVIQLCKELAKYTQILYDSFEEGYSLAMQDALRRFGMGAVSRRMKIVDGMPIDELSEMLSARCAPAAVVIDSFQHAQLTYPQFIAFTEKHPNMLLIFTSHADGRKPEGSAAQKARSTSSMRIYVEGYRAFSLGNRESRKGYYDVWEQQAYVYWGDPDYVDPYKFKFLKRL
ncbi:hypothetical protein EZS27_012334 [termite gut metagenome]|uniref:AAA+ ATPase domain-containing protein n=1 Tax=termite gut metagenome TaxID=433724 RepID=A0A5J4S0S8_9ZZZZ